MKTTLNDMTNPDLQQQRPSDEDINELWKGVIFTKYAYNKTNIDKVVAELDSSHSNGGCKILAAKFIDHPTLHWFVSRNYFNEITFIEKFLSCDIFDDEIKFNLTEEIQWEWSSPYLLDGDIARTLKSGGAYDKFSGTGKEAKTLAQQFCEDLFEDRYEDIIVFKIRSAWSDWFYDVAWDQTWIVIDKKDLIIWAILLTDTD